jgi:hypothetical protein
MPVHFLHIGKTGGTAVKYAIRQSGAREVNPYGRLILHKHDYHLADVPRDDFVFFCVRDPIDRFLSGFYSRLHHGEPRLYRKWKPAERVAFTHFRTPHELATVLGDERHPRHDEAVGAMKGIRHVKHPLSLWLGSPRYLAKRLSQVVFIVRQETLTEEWPKLKTTVGLPDEAELPADPTVAHRGRSTESPALSQAQIRALRDWYAEDYELLDYCEMVRRERGWAAAAPSGGES